MINRDAILILALDYAPILTPSAMALYLCYCALADEDGAVDITYAKIKEHLNKLTNSTISKCNKELKSAGLIDTITEEDEKGPEIVAPHRKREVKVFPFSAFTDKRRKKLFEGRVIESEIREKVLSVERLPLEHQQLLSKRDLQGAFKKLKKEKFTISNLVEFFKLDKDKVKLWLSSKQFRTQLVRTIKEVVDESSRLETQQGIKRIIRRKAGSKIRTADEMYETLMKAGIDKKTGEPIPVEEWTQPSQLLRYFCVLYEKYNAGRKYTMIFPNGKSFSSKELTDMTIMLRAFNDDIQASVKYMEWLFENKEDVLRDGIFGTGIFRTPGMINEYKKKTAKPVKPREIDSIDEQYIAWVHENVPRIFNQFDLNTMKDLYWLKEVYDEEEKTEEVITVVEEGIKRGIIPKEGNITFK
jgi:hypothetical protein